MADDSNFSFNSSMYDSDDFYVSSNDESFEQAPMDISPPKKKASTTLSSKTAPAPKKGKSSSAPALEDVYKKLSQLEHVLHRPDTYIGSVEPKTDESMWVWDDKEERMVYRPVVYVPGLLKIFDEIIVNAADNYQRDGTMKAIKVDINKEKGEISVWNDGKGIPVEMHKKEKMLIGEMIFGHLLTGANFNDDQRKVVGGRNGYGAKLANIFSDKFTVECVDSKRKKKFVMTWSNNMQDKTKAKVTSCAKKTDHTKITFLPQFSRFGLSGIDDDHMALFKKRVYDIAGCNSKIKVYFNGKVLPIRSFEAYCKLYFRPEDGISTVFEKSHERWEICVARGNGEAFQHVSFVNSIATTQGGTHVDHVVKKITTFLKKEINKKNKSATVQPAQIKTNMFFFVNCLIENPAFSAQTKEYMTTQVKNFGSTCKPTEKFLKMVLKKSGISEMALEWARLKQQQQLKRKGGRKVNRLKGIAKLDDANMAGGRNSQKCTLILTEGDSAKTLAVSGFEVVGRDMYGVFPLRGKLLNVRDANHQQIMKNAEISALQKILGLSTGRKVTSTKDLRYGRVMIMTDQDHDGSHIKGLIINFLHNYWPDLLQQSGFLTEFITPIVKVTKGKGKSKKEHCFFTLPEYNEWRSQHSSEKGWKVKYYKGLGTNTPQEAKEYFRNVKNHEIKFRWKNEEDANAIDLAFNKRRADDRKTWLSSYDPEIVNDNNAKSLVYSDFVNKELIHFSVADNSRSIPSMVDGLKPGQRKILYACFKRGMTSELKVAQLAGYVSEHSAYHHGEASLMSTIVAMAQSHVGSNNINLLYPAGSFGSRRLGGKDSASPRYIFTMLSSITRKIFRKEDDPLLTYLDDDGFPVEPEWYIPIIPMILVNGASGIGSGWSTDIPTYNVHDIVKNIRRMLDGHPPSNMHPWFRGFDGSIDWDPSPKYNRYIVRGVHKLNGNTLEITELPIGSWTEPYKEFLEKLSQPSEKPKRDYAVIDYYTEHHTDTSVHFKITLTAKGRKDIGLSRESVEKFFKLSSYLQVGNMHAFNHKGQIQKYELVKDIFKEYFDLRLEYYGKRKAFQIKALELKLQKLDARVRFILGVAGISDETIVLSNQKKQDVVDKLEEMGFPKLPKEAKAEGVNASNKQKKWEAIREIKQEKKVTVQLNYDYLLKMNMLSLTYEKVEKLRRERDAIAEDLEELRAKTPKEIWLNDLDDFLEAFKKFEDEMEEVTSAGRSTGRGRAQRVAGKAGQRPGRHRSSLEANQSGALAVGASSLSISRVAGPEKKPAIAAKTASTASTGVGRGAAKRKSKANPPRVVEESSSEATPPRATKRTRAIAPRAVAKEEPVDKDDSILLSSSESEVDSPIKGKSQPRATSGWKRKSSRATTTTEPSTKKRKEFKQPKPKKPSAAATRRAAASKKKKDAFEMSSSDDDDDDDDDDDVDISLSSEVSSAAPTPSPRRTRGARTRKAVSYKDEDSFVSDGDSSFAVDDDSYVFDDEDDDVYEDDDSSYMD